MTNRILNGIVKAQERIASKNLSPEKLEAARKSMDMDIIEYCMFQERKSAAVGSKLTLDEANTIYGYLGNTPEHFNAQPLAVKYVLTEVFASLNHTCESCGAQQLFGAEEIIIGVAF